VGSIPITRSKKPILTQVTMKNVFTENLLIWFQKHGRHDLPWQQDPTPYRVWVSEIMLQQTQVSTVINYYQRFINKFSSIKLLADAPQDEVLTLWSGLGYYARARNLHRAAQIISQQYGGNFPQEVEELIKLPGIGRSTAGAIASFSMNIRAPILDGNVKRVLARYYAIEGVTSDSNILKRLWELAEQLTPLKNYAEYNQAIMDLGATICTRSKPVCGQCPAVSDCQAFAQSRVDKFPYPKKITRVRPKKFTRMLIVKDTEGRIFLEKRPVTGIWGGLWSFPECTDDHSMSAWCAVYLNAQVLSVDPWPVFSHTFTHFELTIEPVIITAQLQGEMIMEATDKIWYHPCNKLPGGVASPVAKLLQQLRAEI
jgi:A/G-specific adenine glycosylase